MALVQRVITGTLINADGTLQLGKTLRFKPRDVFGDSGIVVPENEVKVVTNATTGAFTVSLYTSDAVGAFTRYDVYIPDGIDYDRRTFDLLAGTPTTLDALLNLYIGAPAVTSVLQPLDSDLTAIAALAPANDDLIQRKAGVWTNRTPAQVKIDLLLVKGDVGLSLVDNTADASKPVSTAQGIADALNLKIASNLADLNNAATARTNLGLVIGTNVQAQNAALAQIAALVDPNVNRVMFWNDLAGTWDFLGLGTNLSITGTTLNAAGGGTVVGGAVTGGGNNQVLHIGATGLLAANANLFFDGTDLGVGIAAALGANLHVKASSNTRVAGIFQTALSNLATANALQANMYDGAIGFSVGPDGGVTMGRSYDAVNLKHAIQHIVRYAGDYGASVYAGKGLKLENMLNGSIVRLQTFANGLYLTDDAGVAAGLQLGTRINPSDSSTFIASSALWAISAGIFQTTNTATAQARFQYDAANYFTLFAGATGEVLFDAAGTGAGFKFAKNIGFNNSAPIAKPAVTGSRGANAALASLLTALASYGLITDSSVV